MIFEEKPEVFEPWYHTVSVFLSNSKGEFLFLRRGQDKHEGGKFCTPGGKKEENETNVETVIREIKEETGIDLNKKDLKYFKKLYVKYPDHDFLFEMFEAKLDYDPQVRLKLDEHSEFVWATLDEAMNLPLVLDGTSCIRLFKLR